MILVLIFYNLYYLKFYILSTSLVPSQQLPIL